MNEFFLYLAEVNIAFLILFIAYRLGFEKDRNFLARRIYLLGIPVFSFLIPLVPDTLRTVVNSVSPVTFNLEEITVYAGTGGLKEQHSLAPGLVLIYAYFAFAGFSMLKMGVQFFGIVRTIRRAGIMEVKGRKVVPSTRLHASSFFGYIFIDPAAIQDATLDHILDHEQVHKQEWHSLDRILSELFVMLNWFNPAAWLYRRSVIGNLEFLADSAVVKQGTDPDRYQLSILNQYIGSASISNQFSNQIKNRIRMLSKNHKLGSPWKLLLIFPLICVAFVAISCSDRAPDTFLKAADDGNRIYYEVEQMPTFQGDASFMPFRKYIAQNLLYPKTAAGNGVDGKVFVTFVVRKDGSVEIPTPEEIAAIDGKSIDEVVVVSYRPLDEESPVPEEEYTRLLELEAIRVITSSPDWEPAMVDGKPVDVAFTMPINFVLQ